MTSPEARKSLHDVRFPGESDEYRRARNELLKAEVGLRRQIETVAAQRRKLPLGGVVPHDYIFEEWDARANAARPVRLSELFEDGKETLFLYSHMFIPGKGDPLEAGCPSCTSIIDGIDGVIPHITQLINFAVVAKAPIERFRAHAKSRGWHRARLLSSANNTYNHDYQAEAPDGSQMPIATSLVRRGGTIHHFWSSELMMAPSDPGQDMRQVDFMWPLWLILDRTPAGRGTEWRPELDYSSRVQPE
ncbi:MAG: DUF899 family protein [Candidatus Dormibacteraceae bacterium]